MDFQKYLANLEVNLNNLAELQVSKDIQYGHMFQYRRGQDKVTLNVYNGKKGLRLVWQGNNALCKELESFVDALNSANKDKTKKTAGNNYDNHAVRQHNKQGAVEAYATQQGVWAGSDESGKGDYFGPLVVSAVAVDTKAAELLQQDGVKDCKLLTNEKILLLEPLIKEKALAFSVLNLKPRFYNQRYAEVVAQGGKLNQLLANGHVVALTQVIEALKRKNLSCSSALVDQFTKSNIVLKPLQQRFPGVQFSQHPNGEANIAVAAASILARAQFLRTMDELAALAGLPSLPRGGGGQTTVCARSLVQKLGSAALENFVKLHFVNTKLL